MNNGRVLAALALIVVVVAIVLVIMFGRPPQPPPATCPSRVTVQVDENLLNRSMSDLKSQQLEMLQSGKADLKLNNQATITGTIKLAIGPATAEPTVVFDTPITVKSGLLSF